MRRRGRSLEEVPGDIPLTTENGVTMGEFLVAP